MTDLCDHIWNVAGAIVNMQPLWLNKWVAW